MWTFRQTGFLFAPDGSPSAHSWYSGFGPHANVPADEGLVGLGPIPRGNYGMAALVTHTHMGPVAIRLEPDAPTLAFILSLGRDPNSFYAHDDTAAHDHKASCGCLVSVSGTGSVMSLWVSVDHALQVIV